MSANKDLTAKLEDGVMWIPATTCPICGSLRAGCFHWRAQRQVRTTRRRAGIPRLAVVGEPQAKSREALLIKLQTIPAIRRTAAIGIIMVSDHRSRATETYRVVKVVKGRERS